MAHYRVTGDLNPDATGVYVETGTYSGSPAYRREDGNYWIWSPGGDMWTLSTEPGELDPGYWAGSIPGIAQTYDPVDDYTGDATVTLIVYAVQIWDGKVLIVDGKVAVHEDCCCEGYECPLCSDTVPQTIRVTIEGIENGACEDCEDLNGTFDCVMVGDGGEATCLWQYDFDAICSCTYLKVVLHGIGTIEVSYGICAFGGGISWFGFGVDIPADCMWEDLDVPFYSHGIMICDASGSTCSITGIA